MTPKKTVSIIVIAALGLLLYLCAYTVTQGEEALLLRLGKIIESSNGQAKIMMPGLHFKVPFLNQVRWFDVRLQTLGVQSSRILTEEQKYVLVDYYVKWRINDVALYYKRTNGISARTQTLLQQKINDALRAEFGQRSISDVISDERKNIMALLLTKADESAEGLGVKVVDVRIKRIDLPKEVSESVFSRMRAQREQVANKHRADGRAAAAKIKAQADKNVVITIASAKATAADLKAKGDAGAAAIYNATYSRDTAFYAFYRSLKAYQHVFRHKDDMIVLKPDSQFFKYFNQANGTKK